MKTLIVGGNGTIGKRLCSQLSKGHDIIIAGRSSGDIQIDISNSASIKSAFNNLDKVDAVICVAGEAKWANAYDLSEDDYYIGLKSKLMGQVNLALIASQHLNKGGSITLTTGILADRPVPMTTSAAMVNGAIHSFVRAFALEIKNNVRINAVSAGLVEDSAEKYKDFFPGHTPVPMQEIVDAYENALTGKMNGDVISVYK